MNNAAERALKKLRDRSASRDSGFAPRIVAEFSSEALISNYRAISKQVPDQWILPMIKANAYGHGASWVAKLLERENQLYGFGAATFEEAREIRTALKPGRSPTRVLVFSGPEPWSEEKGQFCESYGLTPVIASDSDWELFLKQRWNEKIPYELKFNTGMNRLGISMEKLERVASQIKKLKVEFRPQGIASHLAEGETPDSRLSQQQLLSFKTLRTTLSAHIPSAQFHLANSAAIWNSKNWGLRDLTEGVRPGISLYGVSPWPGAPLRGLSPVLKLKAQVVLVRTLRMGDSLGYGGTFTVSRNDQPRRVAILSAGYADGIHRTLSNRGTVYLGGNFEKFAGTISMDLCAVTCGGSVAAGDWAEILGPAIDPWSQSKEAQTLPYELFTSISSRVNRSYE